MANIQIFEGHKDPTSDMTSTEKEIKSTNHQSLTHKPSDDNKVAALTALNAGNSFLQQRQQQEPLYVDVKTIRSRKTFHKHSIVPASHSIPSSWAPPSFVGVSSLIPYKDKSAFMQVKLCCLEV